MNFNSDVQNVERFTINQSMQLHKTQWEIVLYIHVRAGVRQKYNIKNKTIMKKVMAVIWIITQISIITLLITIFMGVNPQFGKNDILIAVGVLGISIITSVVLVDDE